MSKNQSFRFRPFRGELVFPFLLLRASTHLTRLQVARCKWGNGLPAIEAPSWPLLQSQGKTRFLLWETRKQVSFFRAQNLQNRGAEIFLLTHIRDVYTLHEAHPFFAFLGGKSWVIISDNNFFFFERELNANSKSEKPRGTWTLSTSLNNDRMSVMLLPLRILVQKKPLPYLGCLHTKF